MKNFFSKFEEYFCSILLFAMTILTCVNVFARYIFLSSMPFVEELTCAGLVVLSIGGAAVAAKRGAHLGLTLLTDFLPEKVQHFFLLLGHVIGMVFSMILLYFGCLMTRNEYRLGQRTAGMQWPEWLFGMWLPICGAVLLICYTRLAIKESRKRW